MSHLGVLTVLAEAGVTIDCLAGSSLGVLLGGMYAFTPDAAQVRQRALDFFRASPLFGRHPKPTRGDGLQMRLGYWGRWKKYFRALALANWLAARVSVLPRNPARRAAEALLPDADLGQTALPFAGVALDLRQGELKTFNRGPARAIAQAATAVGVVFPPHRLDGVPYVDAAPLCSVPVRACRALGAQVVLAVDLRTPLAEVDEYQNGFDVISRIESVESNYINTAEVAEADLVIRPEVGHLFWGDFTRVDEAAAAGETAARAALPRLLELLQRKGRT